MEIYVIRHTPVAIEKDTCYGQSDVPLANTFAQDVEKIKNHLPIDFDIVYCSPLKRCKDLANALRFENIIFENALMEINFGNWENKKWNDINPQELNNWMTDFVNKKPPGGENLVELFSRVKLFLDDLKNKNYKKVLLITHAGVIRCVWSYFLGVPLESIFTIPVKYDEVLICKPAENRFYLCSH
ncbi:MAG: alpha-ribazole phosphatase [Flammeovirgaceae bacterium]|nr:alpha-ribazole phosphatase [Flammeovirgaceae bacterium]MDW8287764.1 alpha-ribazole phosphatase [Flammeovirgaceae bacterium]